MMKYLIVPALGIALSLCLYACKQDTQVAQAPKPVVVSQQRFDTSGGKDCNKPDSLRTNCVSIALRWLAVDEGNDVLKRNVLSWSNSYLVGLLAPELSADSAAIMPVPTAAQRLIREHAVFVREAPDSPMGQWSVENEGGGLLNNGKYLTLEMSGYAFLGGAHGNPTGAVATFDVATGKQLTWDDLTSDRAALEKVVEQYLNAELKPVLDDGYALPEDYTFALPQNYGLTEKGLYCRYLHYEIGAYAMGSFVFEVPYTALNNLLKIKI